MHGNVVDSYNNGFMSLACRGHVSLCHSVSTARTNSADWPLSFISKPFHFLPSARPLSQLGAKECFKNLTSTLLIYYFAGSQQGTQTCLLYFCIDRGQNCWFPCHRLIYPLTSHHKWWLPLDLVRLPGFGEPVSWGGREQNKFRCLCVLLKSKANGILPATVWRELVALCCNWWSHWCWGEIGKLSVLCVLLWIMLQAFKISPRKVVWKELPTRSRESCLSFSSSASPMPFLPVPTHTPLLCWHFWMKCVLGQSYAFLVTFNW